MKLPTLKQFDAVRVEWQDSMGLSSDWHRPSAKDMTTVGVVTVGQVYKAHKDRITVICSWDSVNKHVDCGITIPARAIDKIQVLR